ncbi:MAG TPA: hypothetical protein VJ851_11060 [Jatrophihabitans sp.]|nr:hypothetical protein [Jatrophihabitans sp.]
MIIGVVSCPQPPLLLPGITGRPVAEVEELRAACLAAVGELLAGGPERIVLVGGCTARERAADRNPLSMQVGRQLLSQADGSLPVEELVVADDASTADCLYLGRALADRITEATGLLVLADGSACRGVKAPGYLDERAAPFDARVQAALTAGDPAGLAALDAELAAELLVAGRAAWQVLAGATEGRRFDARLGYSADPFGVWYPVCGWYS